MDADLVFLRDTLMVEELRDFFPAITLKLDDRTVFFVHNYTPITIETFLQISKYLIEAELLWDTLDSCETFPSVPLLTSDIDEGWSTPNLGS